MKWKLTLAMSDGTEITIEGEFAGQLRGRYLRAGAS